MRARSVDKVIIAREQSEGSGARVRRSIGRPELPNLDPFLLLDEFHVRKPAGFPEYVFLFLNVAFPFDLKPAFLLAS